MGVDYLAYGYATLVALGGVFGYLKAGSIVSLGMGMLFGSILGNGAYQTSQNPANYWIIFGAGSLLAGVMGARYYQSGKFMPAGLVAAISVAMVLRYVVRSLVPKQESANTL